MAVLNGEEKRRLRNLMERRRVRDGEPVDYTKSQIDGAMQALEDWLQDPATRQEVKVAIDAGSGRTWTAAEYKLIFAAFARRVIDRGA